MTHERPLVSVLMAVHNGGEWLADSLSSIAQQTYQDLEVIVFDDGSTDQTSETLRKVQSVDARFKIVTSVQNVGLSSALNRGLESCSGQYIARMDADDLAQPNRIEEQVKFFEANKDVAILGTAWRYFPNSTVILTPPTAYHAMKLEMLRNNPLGHPTVMFNVKNIARDRIRYSIQFPKAQDYELWARLMLAEHYVAANLTNPLLDYRIHPNQLSASKAQLDEADRIREIVFSKMSLFPLAPLIRVNQKIWSGGTANRFTLLFWTTLLIIGAKMKQRISFLETFRFLYNAQLHKHREYRLLKRILSRLKR